MCGSDKEWALQSMNEHWVSSFNDAAKDDDDVDINEYLHELNYMGNFM